MDKLFDATFYRQSQGLTTLHTHTFADLITSTLDTVENPDGVRFTAWTVRLLLIQQVLCRTLLQPHSRPSPRTATRRPNLIYLGFQRPFHVVESIGLAARSNLLAHQVASPCRFQHTVQS